MPILDEKKKRGVFYLNSSFGKLPWGLSYLQSQAGFSHRAAGWPWLALLRKLLRPQKKLWRKQTQTAQDKKGETADLNS